MNSRRIVLAAITLVITFLGVTCAPAFAGLNPACSAQNHECCNNTPSVVMCCSGPQAMASEPGSPVQAHTQVDAAASQFFPCSVPPGTDRLHLSTMYLAHAVPRAASLDLPTLFACLLI